MRGTNRAELAIGSRLRIGLTDRDKLEFDREVAIPWGSLLALTGTYLAEIDYFVDESGHVIFTASVDGFSCDVGWNPKEGKIVTLASAELTEDFVEWCRLAHMNLLSSLCAVAGLVIDEFAEYRLLAAATAGTLPTPSQAIDAKTDAIATLCAAHHLDRLWCTAEVSARTDDVNTVSVNLVYERQSGELSDEEYRLAYAIAALIGYPVLLSWRMPAGLAPQHGLKLEKAREVWKAAKRPTYQAPSG